MRDTTTWRPLQSNTADVLRLLAAGHTMRTAAPQLGLTLSQVTNYVRCGLKRWRVGSRTGLIHLACVRGVVPLDLHPLVEPRRELLSLETVVVRYLAEGNSYAQTAVLINRTQNVVTSAVRGAVHTFQANHMAHAVYRAHQLDLITPAATMNALSLVRVPAWWPLPNTILDVVALVAVGMTNAEIASDLGVTQDVVKERLSQGLTRWRARNRTHLVHLAHERGVFTRRAAGPPLPARREGAVACG
jgi:DNA-binding NarL/FixJ family response regulator